ncbi:hypothetical protein [Aeromicrobium sp. IC_218]|uniref:hypothetical protein n=1 Tax=Aeromicrobium sp. IC_218 TaxID=2545468 RepID=UPI001039D0AB|nr:hypothetical protein [Aeromicrobium sp. IC_218]TCI98817.1 hypothetical protein E0W78_08670 [Aeromicrobium sp. IC_218]
MTTDADAQVEWPTHCPVCGTELRSEVIESVVTNDWNEGSPVPVLAQDVCPNPDCPAKAVGPEGAEQV